MVAKKKKLGAFSKLLIIFLVVSVIGTLLTDWLTRETTTCALPSYTSMLYINDYSHVLSEQTEQFIAAQARELYEKTDVQIAVAVVPSIYSKSLEDFSLELAREWGVGDADKDTGVLIVLTTEEAHVRMEIGYGMEGCLNDAKCGRILDDYCVEPMHNAQWNRAIMQTWVETAKAVYAEYGVDMPEALTSPLDIIEEAGANTSADAEMPQPVTTTDDRPFWERMLTCLVVFWVIAFPVGGFLFLFVWLVLRFGGGSVGGKGGSRSDSDDSGGSSESGSDDSFGGGDFGGGGASR